MSTAIETPPRRSTLRRWWPGVAVAAAVLVLGLVALALVPRPATASASLTVTPRTDAGADAALLLGDRYTALAGSTGTLRAARDAEPALSGTSLEDLAAGTEVRHSTGTATVTVRITLADRDAAVAAANAVVGALVEAGADEELVDVGRGTDATAARADGTDLRRWVLVVLLLAAAAGLATTALTGSGRPGPRPSHPVPPAPPDPVPEPAEPHDDLPGFLDSPPGSTPAATPPRETVQASTGTGATEASPAPAEAGPSPALLTRHGAVTATLAAVVLLVAAAAVVAVPAGGSADAAQPAVRAAPSVARATSTAPGSTAPGSTAPGSTAPGSPEPDAEAPADAGAGALAFESVPLGRDGAAATVSFEGVVLEERAVGLTVTYPSLSITTDGRRSLAHLRLPTYNCLSAEPPADPVASGCARSLTEYADLPSPELRVTRDGDRIELDGAFPTYTRPNGSPPTPTGRAYRLTASVTADGPAQDGRAPATGVVRIGLDSAPTTGDRAANQLQLPG
ncbi:hypothetical protein [Modestobacter versicolor]|uniref:hypothetical protein n=1 Tax=Modestobacter versicolor TaxID=429133 RepID=UPI0034DEF7F3